MKGKAPDAASAVCDDGRQWRNGRNVDNDPRSPVYDPQLDASHKLSTSRLPAVPIEAIGWHQRLVVNPLVAILSTLAGVALIQHALLTRNVVLFCTAVGVLFLSLLLIQFHCRDCGTTGWYLHSSRHACAAVVARWRQNVLARSGLRARTQLLIWSYVMVFSLLGYAVFTLSRM
ncbi:MAG: hypothetical protein ACXWN0_17105 [Isosphaeraceae bacterium]